VSARVSENQFGFVPPGEHKSLPYRYTRNYRNIRALSQYWEKVVLQDRVGDSLF